MKFLLFRKLFSRWRVADECISEKSISETDDSLEKTLTDPECFLPEETDLEDILTALLETQDEIKSTLSGPIVFSYYPVAEIIQFACSCLGLTSQEIREKAEEFKYEYSYFDDYLNNVYVSEKENPVCRYIHIGYGYDYSFCCVMGGSREIDVTVFDRDTWGKCETIIFYYYNPLVIPVISDLLLSKEFKEDTDTEIEFKKSDGSEARIVMARDFTHPILPILCIK